MIRQAVRELGEPKKVPDVRSMAAQIDAQTGATLAIHLYDQSRVAVLTHATSSAMLRHVTHDRRRTTRPTNSWVRRAPVRLADACLGLLVGAIANQIAAPVEPFQRYAEAHARRVLPPLLATIGKGLLRKLNITDLIHTLKQSRDLRVYLARTGPDDAAAERETRLRNLYDHALARLDHDVPPEAMQPIVDHLVTIVLAEWGAEAANTAPPSPPGAAQPNEA